MSKIKGNVDENYELNEAEKGRVHIRCGKRIHDPIKQEYSMNYSVIKLYPAEFANMKKRGAFKEFKSVEILHNPDLGGGQSSEDDLSKLRSDYLVLFGKEADKRLKESGLKTAIEEKSEELKETALELYEEKFEKEPTGLSVVEQLKAVQG